MNRTTRCRMLNNRRSILLRAVKWISYVRLRLCMISWMMQSKSLTIHSHMRWADPSPAVDLTWLENFSHAFSFLLSAAAWNGFHCTHDNFHIVRSFSCHQHTERAHLCSSRSQRGLVELLLAIPDCRYLHSWYDDKIGEQPLKYSCLSVTDWSNFLRRQTLTAEAFRECDFMLEYFQANDTVKTTSSIINNSNDEALLDQVCECLAIRLYVTSP